MAQAQKKTGAQATEDLSLLDELLDQANVDKTDGEAMEIAKRGVSEFMGQLLRARDKFDKVDRTAVDLMIAEVDKRLEAQINEILHDEGVQRLESTWRSIKYFVDHCDFRQNIKVDLLNATKIDLSDDFEDSPETVKTGYYRMLYSAEYGTFGGTPYGCVVTDYEFGSNNEDVRLLQQLASVSAMAHCPLLVNAPPKMFGGDTFEDLPKMRDLKAHFDSPQFGRWRALRSNEDIRNVGMCMPRFMLRQPYEPGQNTVREFAFVEDVIDKHEHYLWGHASFALAARAAAAFADYSWCSNIIGPQSGGAVEDLPIHQYDAMGELQTKLPVEVQLTERREYELSEEGFIGLTFRKGSDNAAFFSANSIQKAKKFLDPTGESELNYRLGTQLPYMFLISRVAHYLKVMQREAIGSYKDRQELEDELQWWLTMHTCKDARGHAAKSRFPFRESSVVVEDVPEIAGWYRVKIQIVPHFKYMGADFVLSLVGKLDKNLSTDE